MKIDFIIWLEDQTGEGVITTDAGGQTRWGISEWAHPEAWQDGPPSRDEAKRIYRDSYWTPCRCDELPGGLDLMMLDSAVQHGQATATELLQQAVGAYPDGILGPQTMAAVRAADVRAALEEYAARRAVHYTYLTSFPSYRLGWMRRLARVFARALEEIE